MICEYVFNYIEKKKERIKARDEEVVEGYEYRKLF